MNELLIALLSLFVGIEAPEHPWLAEAWAEVDQVGSFEECEAEGYTHDVDVSEGFILWGFYARTIWKQGDVIVDTENVICMTLPEATNDAYPFWFTLVHELAHVYEKNLMAPTESRVWANRLDGCTWAEVMADVFAYTVIGSDPGFQIGAYYTDESDQCRLGDTPSQSMINYVGRQARARAGDGEVPPPAGWVSWLSNALRGLD